MDTKFLTRRAAAAYITENYFPIAFKSLEKHACYGTGPRFHKTGPGRSCRVLYAREELDRWAMERMGEPVASTSELSAAE